MAGVPLQLARFIIDAELNTDDQSDDEILRRRVEIAQYFMRVLSLFVNSRMQN